MKRWLPFTAILLVVVFIYGQLSGVLSESRRSQQLQKKLNTVIAVVNADAGVLSDGVKKNYSSAVIDTLDDNFTLVSPIMAYNGYADGTYGAIINFPFDVSAKILSFNANQPEKVQLEYQINPDLPEEDYMETYIAILDLQLSINTTLAHTYVSSIYEQFHQAQDQVKGVFQNDRSDLDALEAVKLEEYAAALELDELPDIPLDPFEADTEGYMDEVRYFAEDVSSRYLNSYESASGSYLFMKERLINLTNNFPEQEDNWLSELEDWVAVSEEYGLDTEEYSNAVSTHETEMVEWHGENVEWNNALENYRQSISDWLDNSQTWHNSAAEWYEQYMEFYAQTSGYKDDLSTYHGELTASMEPVVSDITQWKTDMDSYFAELKAMFDITYESGENYNSYSAEANSFLSELLTLNEGLYGFQGGLTSWREAVLARQAGLSKWQGELTAGQGEFQALIDTLTVTMRELPLLPEKTEYSINHEYYSEQKEIPVVPELPIIPDIIVTTSSALTTTSSAIISIPGIPDGIEETDIPQKLPQVPPFFSSRPGAMTDPGSGPDIHFTSGGGLSADDITDDDLEALTTWYKRLNDYNATLGAWEQNLQAYYDDMRDWRKEFQGYIDAYGEWRKIISDYSDEMIEWNGELLTAAEAMTEWENELKMFSGVMSLWHNDLAGFNQYNDTFYIDLKAWYEELRSDSDKLSSWFDEVSVFSNDLPALSVMPVLPAYEEWEELLNPDLTGPNIPDTVEPLDELMLPEWNDSITPPTEYTGPQVADMFQAESPVPQENAIGEMFLSIPEIYAGIEAPNVVDEIEPLTEEQPDNPMAGAPPRPDDFWSSLGLMHDQLNEFDVGAYLNEEDQRAVDSSLISYNNYLGTVREDLKLQFNDNIVQMYDARDAFSLYLGDLKTDVYGARDLEQEHLQTSLSVYAQTKEANSADTLDRLLKFTGMMPESRSPAGLNRNLVGFTVSPFEMTPLTVRSGNTTGGRMQAQAAESLADTYQRYLMMASSAAGAVFIATLISCAVTLVKKRKK